MRKYKKILGIIIISMFLCMTNMVISYAQEGVENYAEYVDKDMVSVNNYREYIKLSPKEKGGITGYIIYLDKEDDINKSVGYLQKLAQNGYNIYIIKNNTYNDTKKVKISKNIMKRERENINWIINNRPSDNEEVRELLEWTKEKEYRIGEISGYINSLKDLAKNKDIEEINNELHKIRNKI